MRSIIRATTQKISSLWKRKTKVFVQKDFEKKVMECLDLKAQQKQALIETMRGDEDIGLYDDNPKNHGYER